MKETSEVLKTSEVFGYDGLLLLSSRKGNKDEKEKSI